MLPGTSITLFLLGIWLVADSTYNKRGVQAASSTQYGIYACPLEFLSKKKCSKRGWLPYAPYGIKHTYIRIGNTCYEWGDWGYTRHLPCNDRKIYCCTDSSSKKYTGYTRCAHRVGEFEEAWERKVKKYTLWTWNCQKYTDAMKNFLNNCYYNAASAIP